MECIETPLLSDPSKTCNWFHEFDVSFCSSECSLDFGCQAVAINCAQDLDSSNCRSINNCTECTSTPLLSNASKTCQSIDWCYYLHFDEQCSVRNGTMDLAQTNVAFVMRNATTWSIAAMRNTARILLALNLQFVIILVVVAAEEWLSVLLCLSSS